MEPKTAANESKRVKTGNFLMSRYSSNLIPPYIPTKIMAPIWKPIAEYLA